jgi:uncharacterized phage protein (TIGR01671 family)
MSLGGSFFDIENAADGSSWLFGMKVGAHPDDVELMQYTGLKDKNGREIYEGDIVRRPDLGVHATNHQVIYDAPMFVAQDYEQQVPLNFLAPRCEAIGNIYENPELVNN